MKLRKNAIEIDLNIIATLAWLLSPIKAIYTKQSMSSYHQQPTPSEEIMLMQLEKN